MAIAYTVCFLNRAVLGTDEWPADRNWV